MKILSHSLSDTKQAAGQIIATLKKYKENLNSEVTSDISVPVAGVNDVGPVGHSQALIVGLHGDLGSGKTTFSQSVAEALGVEQRVTSPTFVIEKIYETTDDVFKKFIHIDAYRLEGGKELNALDFEQICADSHNLIFIEWPEKVADILPENMFNMYFEFIDEQTRSISYEDPIN